MLLACMYNEYRNIATNCTDRTSDDVLEWPLRDPVQLFAEVTPLEELALLE